MNPITQNMVLGFYNNVGTYTVYAKQGDTNRHITFELVDRLAEYVVENTTHIYVKVKYPNGESLAPIAVSKSGLSNDGTELTVQLTASMLAVSGVTKCEICFIRSDVAPTFDDEGRLTTPNAECLTTQKFNIYVEPSVYEDGFLSSNDQKSLSSLVKAQQVVSNLESYEDNESARIANEDIRVANEATRVSAEQTRVSSEERRDNNETTRASNETARNTAEAKRAALEGSDTKEPLSYQKSEWETITVPYAESRRGIVERMTAMLQGGTYTDSNGATRTISNTYTNLRGQTVTAEPTDKSMTSLVASIQEIASDAVTNRATTAQNVAATTQAASDAQQAATDSQEYCALAESYTHGGTGLASRQGEATDNASYYCTQAAQSCSDAQQYAEIARGLATGKVSLNPRGEYNQDTQYEPLDLVYYLGATYCAVKTTVGNTPTENSEYWQLIVRNIDETSISIASIGTPGLVSPDDSTIGISNEGVIGIKTSYTNSLTTSIAGKADSLNYDDNAKKLQLMAGSKVLSSINIDSDHATTADSLATSGTIIVNLEDTNNQTYTNGGNIFPGVTGVLDEAHGGTGRNSLARVTVGYATSAQDAIYATTQDINDRSTRIATTKFVGDLLAEYLTYGVADLEDGVSVLDNGKLYFKYIE